MRWLYFFVIAFNIQHSHTIAQNLIYNGDFNRIIDSNSTIMNERSSTFEGWVAYHQMANGIYNRPGGGVHQIGCSSTNSATACPGQFVNVGSIDYFCPLPFSGKGYASIISTRDTSFFKHLGRLQLSFPRTKLLTSLKKDTQYCTELRVQVIKGKDSGRCYNLTDDGLGLFFSDTNQLPGAPWTYNITPQVSGWGRIDTSSKWHHLKGNFIADGNEDYMYLGNFAPFNGTLPLNFNSQCNNNPYYHFGVMAYDAVYVFNCNDTIFKLIQKDTAVCFGEPTWLSPKISGFKLMDSITTFHWQTPTGNFTTNDTGILATNAGKYTVEAVINKRFKNKTTFFVNWLSPKPDSLLPESIFLCLNQNQIDFEVPQFNEAEYEWDDGDTSRIKTFYWPGKYGINISTKCWVFNQSINVVNKNCSNNLYVPNAFSPDSDGVNDLFEIFGSDLPIHVIISDRWGNVVYRSNDYQNDWDGSFNGSPLPKGVYSYIIFWSKDTVVTGRKTGTITIIR